MTCDKEDFNSNIHIMTNLHNYFKVNKPTYEKFSDKETKEQEQNSIKAV